MQEVQAKFLADVAKNGIVHTLQWIGTWYDQVAEAAAADELKNALGEFADDAEARELALLDRLLPEAEGISNYNSSAGHNLLREANIAARARLVNRHMFGNTGPSGRRMRWDQVRERLQAEKFAAQAQAGK
ncbi:MULTISPECIES: hypothetical protein [unclassified Variovorax]|uniref:hypothetical protein n=1 Tax=unclassified Variovorax TaxID=663243 RepID=UPI0011AFB9A1|nr:MULTISPECIES: hypothetical protein [unclassified Variovorax]